MCMICVFLLLREKMIECNWLSKSEAINTAFNDQCFYEQHFERSL